MANETTVAVIERPVVNMTEQEAALSKTVTDIEFQAGAITISSEKEYQMAADFGRMLKRRSAEVKDFWKPMKDAAHKAHSEICNKEKAMLEPLANAEKILKQTMGVFLAEQERKRREAEEIARKSAREEADRKLEEAIALYANGDNLAAEAAAEEAEIMDTAASEVAIQPTKLKASGTSSRKDWKVTAVDSTKVPTSIMGVEIRPVDMAAVMRLIRMSKGKVEIPGIKYEETVSIGFRQ